MKRRHVLIVTASGALAFGCGEKIATTGSPPAPEPATTLGPSTEASAEDPPPADAPALPTWEEVASGHPPGATNPPRPELIVTPDGRCFKRWVSGMVRGLPGHTGDRVEACEGEGCGTAIACPEPEASELLAAYRAGQPAPDPNAEE